MVDVDDPAVLLQPGLNIFSFATTKKGKIKTETGEKGKMGKPRPHPFL